MMGLRELLEQKKSRAAALKSLERDLTDAEIREAESLIREIPDLEVKVSRMESTARQMKRLAEAGDTDLEPDDFDGSGLSTAGAKGFLRLGSGGGLAKRIAAGMVKAGGGGVGRKALVPSGQAVAGVQVTPDSPVSEGRPAAGLLDIVPVIPDTAARFEFLRQVEREMNAAPVLPGARKPTSVLGLERVPGELRVIAHLSEGIDQYILQDFAALEQFVSAELIHGLVQAVESQMLVGDGEGANLEGILSTTGVLDQPSAGDRLVTTRKAITRLERAGLVPSGFAFAPEDWEALELSRSTGSGVLELVDSPVDRARRQLHGVPVAVSAGLEPGRGVLLSHDAVALRVDSGIAVRWSESSGDDFEENKVRARVEVRAAVQTMRPAGIVALNLDGSVDGDD